MKEELLKMKERYGSLVIIYLDATGKLTKRKLKLLFIGDHTFRAFCYLRNEKRTFQIANVLALHPIPTKERSVI